MVYFPKLVWLGLNIKARETRRCNHEWTIQIKTRLNPSDNEGREVSALCKTLAFLLIQSSRVDINMRKQIPLKTRAVQ